MLVRETFEKDINRSINGVVKVEQRGEDDIRQEIEEYVITRELQRHLSLLLDNYCFGLDTPTDRVGVWISGFFGSGKSHFLKMLSYVLENGMVAGKHVIDYFDGKIKDPLVASNLRRAVEVPTESILFNIDTIASHWKEGDAAETALLRAFERAFYEHRGYYGMDFKLAKLEEFIDSRGKLEEFHSAFFRINGNAWEQARPEYEFWAEDIADALDETMGMSRETLMGWLDNSNDVALPPDEFARKVAEYCTRREQECGGSFRLLFMVDEVGQFIGDDTSRMLTLQTIVEQLGAVCGGRAWVMVTSQEAIDDVVKVIGGDKFSKIQGRFNTRLSLSSSSVDEVIKKRILFKNEAAFDVLRSEYNQQAPVLKNLFTFDDSQGDVAGFSSDEDFASSFPFVGYQFKILPNVMTAIRKSGIKAKHMSTGERSMLSAFQESAQAVKDGPLTTLVPFWRFFDTISRDLEHGIIQVVTRASDAANGDQGLQESDVHVLKALYLIRNIQDIRATPGNIAILMIDDINVDKIALREQVKASLDRLVRENYVSRQGEIYLFLTDEEQDIEREISRVQVDSAEVIEQIKKIVFDGIYTDRKLRKGANDYPVDRYVDDTVHGMAGGGMKLNIITYAHELFQANDGDLRLKSAGQAIMILSDTSAYYEVIEKSAKIARYIRTQNVSQLPPSTQQIIRGKQAEARACEQEAKGLLEDAIVHARCAVDGRIIQPRTTKPKDCIANVLNELVDAVFTKASFIDAPVASDNEIELVLKGAGQQGAENGGGINKDACDEVALFLEAQERVGQPAIMGDIQRKFQKAPYGWREADVAAVVARLIADKRAQASLDGKTLDASDRHLLNSLRGKQADQLVVKVRHEADAKLLKHVRDIMFDFAPEINVPEDEDGLMAALKSVLADRRDHCQDLIDNEYAKRGLEYPYPGRAVVEEGLRNISEVLGSEADPETLMRAFASHEDDLLDFAEDMVRVDGFFPNQQRIFDAAVETLDLMGEERVYIEGREDVVGKIDEMKAILDKPEPYRDIATLGQMCTEVREMHDGLVDARRADLLQGIENALEEVRDYARDVSEANGVPVVGVLSKAEEQIAMRKSMTHGAKTLTKLDALSAQLNAWRDSTMTKIDATVTTAVEARDSRPQSKEPVEILSQRGEESTPVAPASKPALPRIKVLRREEVCPVKALKTPEEVDAYVESIRQKLMTALEDNDAVRLG